MPSRVTVGALAPIHERRVYCVSMQASEIRARFLSYFQGHQHAVRPSSSLVPADDPTLLFTNSGMVQFKKVFLGEQQTEFGPRAATVQKCVRAGGKHNDLEQVGHTLRHHTFFEMLGNFSFGDYFKAEAIRLAWEFVTEELALDPRHLRVSVYHSDEEARDLWRDVAGLPPSRIYGLGEKDNFWQMGETGPCGPCSEIYVDLAHLATDWSFPAGATGEWTERDRADFSLDAFVVGAEAGRFLEIWNLVFMQFDRAADGTLTPLPKRSIDAGAGLERIAAVMQGTTSNFHTALFTPILRTIEEVVGVPYWGRESDEPRRGIAAHLPGGVRRIIPNAVEPASFRVIADHARAVAFLLGDGVFPSNEGRGYVLRRILRRAVRHAWLLGRQEPTLAPVVQAVIDSMGGIYPELLHRAKHIVDTTSAEEERFLATIDAGMARFDELAPPATTQGSTAVRGTISGEEAFVLYDRYGFPIDLTELMARERGYTVDIAGFEAALETQRQQSQADRKAKKIGVAVDQLSEGAWEAESSPLAAATPRDISETVFVGYDTVEIETQVTAVRRLGDDRLAVMLRETPFYAESGGQIADVGEIIGEGWRVDVDDVRRVDGRVAALGRLTGSFKFGRVVARVPSDRRRDTERNHTATHLLHASLRDVLGEHVHQAGSLVAPDRLRFDFTHNGPMKPEQIAAVEQQVNRAIFAATPLTFEEKRYADAIAEGAMALFGEKYGDVVRVVKVPGVSTELCGGTHVRNTAEIGLFRIASETGVAAGVRRIEAVTGPLAFEMMLQKERELGEIERLVRAQPGAAVKRVQTLLEKAKESDRLVAEARRSGVAGTGDAAANGSGALIEQSQTVDGVRVIASSVEARDLKSLQSIGD